MIQPMANNFNCIGKVSRSKFLECHLLYSSKNPRAKNMRQKTMAMALVEISLPKIAVNPKRNTAIFNLNLASPVTESCKIIFYFLCKLKIKKCENGNLPKIKTTSQLNVRPFIVLISIKILSVPETRLTP